MLHLTDARTGRTQPAAAPGVRRLRVACGSPSLRAALTTDLVRRAAERHRLMVAVVRPPGSAGGLDPLSLNIHPAASPDAADDPPEVAVTVSAGTASAESGSEGDVPAGAVPDGDAPESGTPKDDTPEGDKPQDTAPRILLTVPDDPAPGTSAAAAWQDADPLTLRLALLARHFTDPAPVGADDLGAAAARLARLRADVARFAESPSAAMPTDRVAAVHAAVDDDLDTPRALDLVDALRTDNELPPGARFEALIHLDRTLGLDLAQDIGKAPQ